MCSSRRSQASAVRAGDVIERVVEEKAEKVGAKSEQKVFAVLQRQQQNLRPLQGEPRRLEVRVRPVQDLLQEQVLQRGARLCRTQNSGQNETGKGEELGSSATTAAS